jgi:ribonucleoside-triphosphate reductase
MSFREHFRKGQRYFRENKSVADEHLCFENTQIKRLFPKTYAYAHAETVAETQQAAEALIHNLNTMSSRAGGQIPFTSINYGMCTSAAGRLVSHALLDATIRGLGNGETPIFPQQIFQCKRGVNQAPGDANYDLFTKAIECSSRRLYPNFVNVDASFNLPHYRAEDPDTFAATMGCRTRVLPDRHGRAHCSGRGNLSFNTVNLVRLGIDYGVSLGEREHPDYCGFFTALQRQTEIAIRGLLHRYETQCRQPAKASDFMMREGAWENGDTLKPDEEVRELLRHGTLAAGFIGLAECLKALTGAHHGESADSYRIGREIISFMRNICDAAAEAHDTNISLFATPAEGLAGKFTKMDRSKFGAIVGVTHRDYYTNSFHVPVYYDIPAHKKIELEAPFHALCGAGAISYVELDGNMRKNTAAFQRIVQYALAQDIGYFSINHPLDRCPDCGYEGEIGAECPNCGVSEKDAHFYRLRRVTGYLTGDYTRRFNSAKQAEVADRVRHGTETPE